jgi:hypothetical protein
MKLNTLSMQRARFDHTAPIRSGIQLGLHIYSKLSSLSKLELEETKSDLDSKTNFSINYNLQYAGRETIWTENCATMLHKSQLVNLEYLLGSSEQTIHLRMSALNLEGKSVDTHVAFSMH